MAVTTRQITSNILGLIGAAVGGVLGYYIFMWIFYQGFYGLMIPAHFVGLGCSLLSQHRSQVRGVLCGVAASGPRYVLGMAFRPVQSPTRALPILRRTFIR